MSQLVVSPVDPAEVEDYFFRLIGKVQLLAGGDQSEPVSDAPVPERQRLLVVSSKYGITLFAKGCSLVVAATAILVREAEAGKARGQVGQASCGERLQQFPTPGHVRSISLSVDETVAACVVDSGVLFVELCSAFADNAGQSLWSAKLNTADVEGKPEGPAKVRSFQWRPRAPFAEFVLVDESGEVFHGVYAHPAPLLYQRKELLSCSCLAWTVDGMSVGGLRMDMTERTKAGATACTLFVAAAPATPSHPFISRGELRMDESGINDDEGFLPCDLDDIRYDSLAFVNDTTLLVEGTSGEEDVCILLALEAQSSFADGLDSSSLCVTVLEGVCDPIDPDATHTGQGPYLHTCLIPSWSDLCLLSHRKGADDHICLVGVTEGDRTRRLMIIKEDKFRARIELCDNYDSNYVTGMQLDVSSTELDVDHPLDPARSFPPCPVLLCSTTEGSLVCFTFGRMDGEQPSILPPASSIPAPHRVRQLPSLTENGPADETGALTHVEERQSKDQIRLAVNEVALSADLPDDDDDDDFEEEDDEDTDVESEDDNSDESASDSGSDEETEDDNVAAERSSPTGSEPEVAGSVQPSVPVFPAIPLGNVHVSSSPPSMDAPSLAAKPSAFSGKKLMSTTTVVPSFTFPSLSTSHEQQKAGLPFLSGAESVSEASAWASPFAAPAASQGTGSSAVLSAKTLSAVGETDPKLSISHGKAASDNSDSFRQKSADDTAGTAVESSESKEYSEGSAYPQTLPTVPVSAGDGPHQDAPCAPVGSLASVSVGDAHREKSEPSTNSSYPPSMPAVGAFGAKPAEQKKSSSGSSYPPSMPAVSAFGAKPANASGAGNGGKHPLSTAAVDASGPNFAAGLMKAKDLSSEATVLRAEGTQVGGQVESDKGDLFGDIRDSFEKSMESVEFMVNEVAVCVDDACSRQGGDALSLLAQEVQARLVEVDKDMHALRIRQGEAKQTLSEALRSQVEVASNVGRLTDEEYLTLLEQSPLDPKLSSLRVEIENHKQFLTHAISNLTDHVESLEAESLSLRRQKQLLQRRIAPWRAQAKSQFESLQTLYKTVENQRDVASCQELRLASLSRRIREFSVGESIGFSRPEEAGLDRVGMSTPIPSSVQTKHSLHPATPSSSFQPRSLHKTMAQQLLSDGNTRITSLRKSRLNCERIPATEETNHAGNGKLEEKFLSTLQPEDASPTDVVAQERLLSPDSKDVVPPPTLSEVTLPPSNAAPVKSVQPRADSDTRLSPFSSTAPQASPHASATTTSVGADRPHVTSEQSPVAPYNPTGFAVSATSKPSPAPVLQGFGARPVSGHEPHSTLGTPDSSHSVVAEQEQPSEIKQSSPGAIGCQHNPEGQPAGEAALHSVEAQTLPSVAQLKTPAKQIQIPHEASLQLNAASVIEKPASLSETPVASNHIPEGSNSKARSLFPVAAEKSVHPGSNTDGVPSKPLLQGTPAPSGFAENDTAKTMLPSLTPTNEGDVKGHTAPVAGKIASFQAPTSSQPAKSDVAATGGAEGTDGSRLSNPFGTSKPFSFGPSPAAEAKDTVLGFGLALSDAKDAPGIKSSPVSNVFGKGLSFPATTPTPFAQASSSSASGFSSSAPFASSTQFGSSQATGSTQSTAFGSTPSPTDAQAFKASETPKAAPFGAFGGKASPGAFGSGLSPSSASPFGMKSQSASLFGSSSSQAGSAPFGSSPNPAPAFGAKPNTSTTPGFGMPSAFGQPAPPTGNAFGGGAPVFGKPAPLGAGSAFGSGNFGSMSPSTRQTPGASNTSFGTFGSPAKLGQAPFGSTNSPGFGSPSPTRPGAATPSSGGFGAFASNGSGFKAVAQTTSPGAFGAASGPNAFSSLASQGGNAFGNVSSQPQGFGAFSGGGNAFSSFGGSQSQNAFGSTPGQPPPQHFQMRR